MDERRVGKGHLRALLRLALSDKGLGIPVEVLIQPYKTAKKVA